MTTQAAAVTNPKTRGSKTMTMVGACGTQQHSGHVQLEDGQLGVTQKQSTEFSSHSASGVTLIPISTQEAIRVGTKHTELISMQREASAPNWVASVQP
mmetsp:Transcript_9491/g.16320  ORF Transcript_9491/g.16320 Transcript_9491/m.16320 type:complete len:98 (-) Transcript_9491:431-724(-)